MPPTRKKEDAKEHSRRHRLLSAGRDIMWVKGYSATSVDDICKAAEVTKGAFFHHFRSKEVMAHEVLERYAERLLAPMGFARDPRGQKDPLRRLRGMFDQLIAVYEKDSVTPGCLLSVLVCDLGGVSEDIREIVSRALQKLKLAIQEEIEAAMDFHEKRGVDASLLATTAVATVQGALLLARSEHDQNCIKKTIREFVDLIEFRIMNS